MCPVCSICADSKIDSIVPAVCHQGLQELTGVPPELGGPEQLHAFITLANLLTHTNGLLYLNDVLIPYIYCII